jgi:glycosyltransferase involved in cell wall biosynthesis
VSPLKIAAKIDKVDEAYFRATIASLFNQPGVEYVGEIDERAKTGFLGGASALLFLVGWPEPFGLSMIEAMAYGHAGARLSLRLWSPRSLIRVCASPCTI